MNLTYVANLRLPTEKAYGIQIAKTCEALGKLTDLTLVYPTRKNGIKEDIFEYYGLEKTFKTQVVKTPDFYWPDKLSFLIKSFISAVNLISKLPIADMYYTRDELVAFLLSFNHNVVFECHKYSWKRKLFYTRLKNLRTIAISIILKADLLRAGFKDVTVARDGVDLKMFDLETEKTESIIYTGRTWKGNFMPESITWIKNLPYKEIPRLLKQAKILVLPNNNDDPYTSPMKMFEYMASGTPIASSNIPAIREVLNESNAVLVDPDDIKRGIQTLLDNSELGRRLAAQARKDVEQYTWDERAKIILNSKDE